MYSAATNKGVKQINGVPTSLNSTRIGSRKAANDLVPGMNAEKTTPLNLHFAGLSKRQLLTNMFTRKVLPPS
jgi:hypothetical protein